MSEIEVLVFMLGIYFFFAYFIKWFRPFYSVWPNNRLNFATWYFFLLPVIVFIIFFITVKFLASFDVVDSFIFKLFYIILGYPWIHFSLMLFSLLLDLSWKDDIINLNNKASLYAISGAYLATSLIYAGANVGDGPGFWCVFASCGTGLFLFILITYIIQKITGVIDEITIGRDKNAGIRMGLYFIASGIILGRAAAGDWISFEQTILDFWVAWPLIVISIIVIFVELYYKNKEYQDDIEITSVLIGLFYIVLVIVVLFALPNLPENPIYELLWS